MLNAIAPYLLFLVIWCAVGLPMALHSQRVRRTHDTTTVFVLAMLSWPLWLTGLLIDINHRR